MREMLYCPSCGSTWSADEGEKMTNCPECHAQLVKMNITKAEWDNMTDAEKGAKKAALKETRTDIVYLAQIANEVKSIAFWVRLWSVLSVIGILGYVILFFAESF